FTIVKDCNNSNNAAVTLHWLMSHHLTNRLETIANKSHSRRDIITELNTDRHRADFGADRIERFASLFNEASREQVALAQRTRLAQTLTVDGLPRYWKLNPGVRDWGLNPPDGRARFREGNKISELQWAKTHLRYNPKAILPVKMSDL